MKRFVWFLIIVVVIGYLGFRFVLPMVFGPPGMMGGMGGAMPASVSKVVKKQVTLWDEFTGRLRAVEDVQIMPRVSGTIEAVHFHEGDFVKKNDKLFTIDLKPFTAEFNRADAAYQATQASAELARVALERTRGLLEKGAVSKQQFDERTSAAKEAEAAVKAAAAARESARLNLEYATVRSPINGKAGRVEITVGNVVNAGLQAPVMTTIQSIDPIYVDFEIDEQAYLRFLSSAATSREAREKIPVKMALANEAEPLHAGRIHSFDNQLNPVSGTLRVRAAFDNKDGALTPGLFARVALGSAEPQEVLLINDKAVGTDQSKKFVYVVKDDGSLEHRVITLGPMAEGLRVVESGLQEDEPIIVNGLMRMNPASKVVPQMVPMDTLEHETPPSPPTPAP